MNSVTGVGTWPQLNYRLNNLKAWGYRKVVFVLIQSVPYLIVRKYGSDISRNHKANYFFRSIHPKGLSPSYANSSSYFWLLHHLTVAGVGGEVWSQKKRMSSSGWSFLRTRTWQAAPGEPLPAGTQRAAPTLHPGLCMLALSKLIVISWDQFLIDISNVITRTLKQDFLYMPDYSMEHMGFSLYRDFKHVPFIRTNRLKSFYLRSLKVFMF